MQIDSLDQTSLPKIYYKRGAKSENNLKTAPLGGFATPARPSLTRAGRLLRNPACTKPERDG
jgi:hypothetical protein